MHVSKSFGVNCSIGQHFILCFVLLVAALPVEEAKRNPNLMLAVLERGGHIGFTDSALPVGKCFMDRVLVQFLNAVLEHNAFTA